MCSIGLIQHFHEISGTYTGVRGNYNIVEYRENLMCIYLNNLGGAGVVKDCVYISRF